MEYFDIDSANRSPSDNQDPTPLEVFRPLLASGMEEFGECARLGIKPATFGPLCKLQSIHLVPPVAWPESRGQIRSSG
jgi:hypothetical protein